MSIILALAHAHKSVVPVQGPGSGWAVREPSRGMLVCLTLLQVCLTLLQVCLSADHLLITPLDSSSHWFSPADECCFQESWPWESSTCDFCHMGRAGVCCKSLSSFSSFRNDRQGTASRLLGRCSSLSLRFHGFLNFTYFLSGLRADINWACGGRGFSLTPPFLLGCCLETVTPPQLLTGELQPPSLPLHGCCRACSLS